MIKKIIQKCRKYIPEKEKLHGTFLHRVFGDQLFDPRLWKITKNRFAAGFGLGMFVAFTPTFPIQMFLAGILAFIFKVNIPIAMAACWITNPFTAPFVFYIEYEVGVWTSNLLGFTKAYEITKTISETSGTTLGIIDSTSQVSRLFSKFYDKASIFIIGSLVCGAVFGIITYIGTYFLMDHLPFTRKKKDDDKDDSGEFELP